MSWHTTLTENIKNSANFAASDYTLENSNGVADPNGSVLKITKANFTFPDYTIPSGKTVKLRMEGVSKSNSWHYIGENKTLTVHGTLSLAGNGAHTLTQHLKLFLKSNSNLINATGGVIETQYATIFVGVGGASGLSLGDPDYKDTNLGQNSKFHNQQGATANLKWNGAFLLREEGTFINDGTLHLIPDAGSAGSNGAGLDILGGTFLNNSQEHTTMGYISFGSSDGMSNNSTIPGLIINNGYISSTILHNYSVAGETKPIVFSKAALDTGTADNPGPQHTTRVTEQGGSAYPWWPEIVADMEGISKTVYTINYNRTGTQNREYTLIANVGITTAVTLITIDANETLIVPAGKTLRATKIVNNGKFVINGTVYINGTFEGTGSVVKGGSGVIKDNDGNAVTQQSSSSTQQSSSVVGDPYVCSLKTGEVWKMPNFEGYSRMLQGTIDNQQLTINVKTTFNTDEEIKETVDYAIQGAEYLNVDYTTLLRTHHVAAKRESFMRELWVQLGQKEMRINMEQLIASNNAFSVSQTDNQAFMVDYDCHDSNNLRIDLTDDLHIIISKFDNPQVKTGFSLKGNTSQIKNTSGALCNKLYKEDMILEEITSIEPIQQLEDRAPKGNINEIYYNTKGKKVSKSIPYF